MAVNYGKRLRGAVSAAAVAVTEESKPTENIEQWECEYCGTRYAFDSSMGYGVMPGNCTHGDCPANPENRVKAAQVQAAEATEGLASFGHASYGEPAELIVDEDEDDTVIDLSGSISRTIGKSVLSTTLEAHFDEVVGLRGVELQPVSKTRPKTKSVDVSHIGWGKPRRKSR